MILYVIFNHKQIKYGFEDNMAVYGLGKLEYSIWPEAKCYNTVLAWTVR